MNIALCIKSEKHQINFKRDPEIDSNELYENTHDLQYSTASD